MMQRLPQGVNRPHTKRPVTTAQWIDRLRLHSLAAQAADGDACGRALGNVRRLGHSGRSRSPHRSPSSRGTAAPQADPPSCTGCGRRCGGVAAGQQTPRCAQETVGAACEGAAPPGRRRVPAWRCECQAAAPVAGRCTPAERRSRPALSRPANSLLAGLSSARRRAPRLPALGPHGRLAPAAPSCCAASCASSACR